MEQNSPQTARRLPDEAKLNTLVSAMADAQAKARAEAVEKAAQVRKKRKLHPAVPFLLLIPLAGILYVNLTRPLAEPPVPAELSLRETVFVTALALNAEFEETGTYPSDLESIGMDEEGLRYTATSDGYLLTAREDSIQVEYRFGEDLQPFRAAFERLVNAAEEVQ